MIRVRAIENWGGHPFLWLMGFLLLLLDLKAQDTTPPQEPIIDSVSYINSTPVNPLGDVIISWKPSSSNDVRSYYIKYLNKDLGVYKLIDSVNAHTFSYIDHQSIIKAGMQQTYVVQAIDSANNASIHSPQHSTISLKANLKRKDCKNYVHFSWTAYNWWNEGVKKYQIFDEQSDHIILLGETAAADTTFTYLLPDTTKIFRFIVRAYSKKGKTSTSNKLNINGNQSVRPRFIDAVLTSVSGSAIEIKFKLDAEAKINNYQVFRLAEGDSLYRKIADYPRFVQPELIHKDDKVALNDKFYKYRLKVFDNCDNLIDSSNSVSSVCVKAKAGTRPYVNDVVWNPFRNSKAHNLEYTLVRITQKQGVKELFNATYVLPYRDWIEEQDYNQFEGDFCYQVWVQSSLFPKEMAKSNKICIHQNPVIEIPTAFIPYGNKKNRIFKPFCTFISEKNYYFSVYNRWGLKVFETSDKNKGWDGKKNGELFPLGRYQYFVKYSDSQGKEYTKKGHLFLDN